MILAFFDSFRGAKSAKQSFGYAILGFALTEAIALFALMMAFFILFVFPFESFFLFHKASTSFFPALVDRAKFLNRGEKEKRIQMIELKLELEVK